MTDGFDYLGRARLQGLTLLAVAFLVGALAGAAGDRLLTRPRVAEPPPREAREGPRLPSVLERMQLTAEQRATIDSILASGRPRNEAIVNEVMPRLRAVSDSLQEAIRAALTPAQAAEFDAYQRTHRPRLGPAHDAAMEPVAPERGRVPAATDGERPPRSDPERPGAADGRRPPPRREGEERRPPPQDGDPRRPPPPPGAAGAPPPPPRDGER
jgi:hypothetical protein